jgi:hypothetical protein
MTKPHIWMPSPAPWISGTPPFLPTSDVGLQLGLPTAVGTPVSDGCGLCDEPECVPDDLDELVVPGGVCVLLVHADSSPAARTAATAPRICAMTARVSLCANLWATL